MHLFHLVRKLILHPSSSLPPPPSSFLLHLTSLTLLNMHDIKISFHSINIKHKCYYSLFKYGASNTRDIIQQHLINNTHKMLAILSEQSIKKTMKKIVGNPNKRLIWTTMHSAYKQMKYFWKKQSHKQGTVYNTQEKKILKNKNIRLKLEPLC